MERVTIRTLSRETAAVLDRVERGEQIDVQRGRRIVAKVVPAHQDRERRAAWKEHFEWLAGLAAPRRRPRVDPVDELLDERRRHNSRA